MIQFNLAILAKNFSKKQLWILNHFLFGPLGRGRLSKMKTTRCNEKGAAFMTSSHHIITANACILSQVEQPEFGQADFLRSLRGWDVGNFAICGLGGDEMVELFLVFSSPGKGSKNMWDDFLEESNRIKNIPTQKLTWHWTSPFSMGNTSSFMVDLPSSHVSFPGGTYQKTWYHPWLNNTRAMLRKVVQVDPKPRRLERRRRYPHLQGGRPGGLKSCKLTDGWIRWWWHR